MLVSMVSWSRACRSAGTQAPLSRMRLPHREPLGRVARVEAELALGVVERLAALAQPALEGRLDAAAVGRAVEAALAGLLGQLGGARGIVVPGHAPLGQRDAGLLEGRLVDHHRARVGAEADAVGLAVDLAAGDRLLGEAREVEGAGRHRVVERQQHAAARVLEDVAVVHLHDVGGVAAGGLRGEPRPVVVPAGALALEATPGLAAVKSSITFAVRSLRFVLPHHIRRMRASCAQAPRTPSAPSDARPAAPASRLRLSMRTVMLDSSPCDRRAGRSCEAAFAADNHLVTCYGEEIVLVKRIARRIASG